LLARTLGLSAGIIGLVFSVSAVFGLLGAFTATKFAKLVGQGPAIWMSIAFTSPFGLVAPLAQRGWLLWAAALCSGVDWSGAFVYNINQVSSRQGLTPDRLLGRMNATMRFLVWGTLPVGSLIGGILGNQLGVRPAMWIGAIGGCLAFLPVLLSPLRT